MLGLLKIRLSDFCNIIFSTAANGKVSAVSAWPLVVSLWQNNMICLISTAYLFVDTLPFAWLASFFKLPPIDDLQSMLNAKTQTMG
ncbi:MAG: hypothetical protein MUD08_19530 [Cytophagales bacterium]|nr:hypothetical protein [Cytophagales bacterium]